MQRRRAAAVAAERKLWLDRRSGRGFEGGGWNFGARKGGGRSCDICWVMVLREWRGFGILVVRVDGRFLAGGGSHNL